MSFITGSKWGGNVCVTRSEAFKSFTWQLLLLHNANKLKFVCITVSETHTRELLAILFRMPFHLMLRGLDFFFLYSFNYLDVSVL